MGVLDQLAQWLVSQSASLVVYGSVVVALGVMAVSPRVIRQRLRTAVFMGMAFAFMRWVLPRLWKPGGDYDDLEAVAGAVGAICVARVFFVIVLDLLLERAGRRPINALVRDVVQFGGYTVVALIALRSANVRPSSLLATGTVMTAVIGLSLQETLGNLAAGAAIQLEQPVDEGDWIRLDKGDILGRVTAMNWRAITIETDENSRYVIPNGVFSKTPFTNYSRPGRVFRRSLYFTVPYDVSPSRVQEALLAACADCPHILLNPAPSVFVWAPSERGLTYWVRYWIDDFTKRDSTQGDVTRRVWYQFHRRKIPFALASQHNYIHQMDAAARLERDQEVLRDRRDAIEGVDFLRPLSERAKDLLAHRGHRKLFAPGEVILRQGETGRSFFIVRRGSVSVTMNGVPMTRLGPGEFFGELALLTGRERFANVTAADETEVFEIDEVMFRDVLQEEPGVAERVSEIVGQRQAELDAFGSQEGPASLRDPKGFTDDILAKVKRLFALD